jgi:methylmalonyl-CoA epimerase
MEVDHGNTWKSAMKIHHVAYLTKNIDRKADELCRLLGVSRLAEPVVDPGQGVRIVFLDLGGTHLELIEPAGDDSPVAKRVLKSPGLFHLCFEVDDLEETLRRLEATGEVTVIKPPQPAPAIGQRRVAFVVTSGNDLFEFVESRSKEQST